MKIRRWVTAGLVLGSMLSILLGCGHSPTEPSGSLGFQTVLKATRPGNPPDLQGGGTVRDRARWQAVWTELHGGLPAPLPEIDFSRETVVLAVVPGCQANVEIVAIDRERGESVVRTQAKSCAIALCARAEFAVHVVRLPRFEGPVRFDLRHDAGLC
ncbi:MAG TPA: hypothetical protein VKK31_28080 [Thermoanaerobaculia bacterium]|nr:hypothetical protein [Thermoanaerobaculia bacterium]